MATTLRDKITRLILPSIFVALVIPLHIIIPRRYIFGDCKIQTIHPFQSDCNPTFTVKFLSDDSSINAPLLNLTTSAVCRALSNGSCSRSHECLRRVNETVSCVYKRSAEVVQENPGSEYIVVLVLAYFAYWTFGMFAVGILTEQVLNAIRWMVLPLRRNRYDNVLRQTIARKRREVQAPERVKKENVEEQRMEEEVDDRYKRKLLDDGWMCFICLEMPMRLEDMGEVTELSCSHVFHTGCIDEWEAKNAKRRCPGCEG